MAKPLVPDDLWAAVAPLLPPEPPKPKGGRPRLSDRAALTGIVFVLRSGLPWEMLPAEMGCGSGMSCWRRLACSRGLGGAAANQHDSQMPAPTLDAIPPLRGGRRGCPRRRPDKLHADKGYDHRRCRRECRARGITPRIARRGIDSSQRLGKYRWVVERLAVRRKLRGAKPAEQAGPQDITKAPIIVKNAKDVSQPDTSDVRPFKAGSCVADRRAGVVINAEAFE
jgi:transposase